MSDVVVADTRGRVFRNVSRGHSVFNDEPTWSPNGRYITFHSGWRASALMVADLRTGELDEFAGSGYNAEPAWSPDGQLIAYREESDHMTNVAPDDKEGIYVIPTGRGAPRLLIPNGASPAWSPDGRKIAYVVARSNRSPWEAGEIAVANADGSEPRLVTQTPEVEADPAWSPDGRTLAFTRRDQHGRGAIVVAEADGSNERVVFRRPGVSGSDPAWRPPRALPLRYPRCPRR